MYLKYFCGAIVPIDYKHRQATYFVINADSCHVTSAVVKE